MGIRLMGVYKGVKRIGYEIFFGMEARFFPPKEDLVNLHRNILMVRNRKDGFLLFLNVNLATVVEEKERLKELFRESEEIPFIAIVELRMDELKEYLDRYPRDIEETLSSVRYDFPAPLSFSGTKLTPEDYEVIKKFSPEYVKLSIKEVACLSQEAIETLILMFEEITSSAVVFTHVETEEEFRKVPRDALWLGYYEEQMLSANRGSL